MAPDAETALHEEPEFGRFYGDHVTRVYRYFVTQVASREDAEDLTAETFADALRGWGRRSGDSETGWLLAIARRRLADHYRHTARRRSAAAPAWARESLIGDPADQVGDPFVAERLGRLLAQLPALDRELLRLCINLGVSYADAGRVTGLRADAVKMRVHRALRRLREMIRVQEVMTDERR